MSTRTHDAASFHELHRELLLLPNAWDAASAKVVELAGAKAVATSSAAVAWAHGFADGHELPFAKLVETVEEVARVVSVPISADVEGGYANDPARVAENVLALIEAGAVGINLEDGREEHELHLRKIEAVREAARRAGVDLFINARTDVYLAQLVPADSAAEEAIRRGRACLAAGASGVFVPLVCQPHEIAAIVRSIDAPLNVLVCSGLPNAAALQAMGVRRLSAGSELARAALRAARDAAVELLAEGDAALLERRVGERVNFNGMFKR
jgi:2-methylisocitrate lyase-like PEP mutase family enzyme